MKSRILLLKAAVAAILTSGISVACTDLEYENYTYLDYESFPKSDEDLYNALIGVYNTVGNSFVYQWLNNAGLIAQSLPTDELNTGWTSNPWILFDTFTWTANNDPIETCYTAYQRGITKATKIIVAVENNSTLNENVRRQYIAELKTLRVFFMQQIYSLVGPVPVVRDPEVATDVYSDWTPSRPTREEYVRWMEDDILSSYEDLDVSTTQENWGRMTRGAALMLLERIYLNEKRWEDALEVCDQIIGLNQYKLMDNYQDIFSTEYEGPSNTEAIFIIGRIVSNTNFAWTWTVDVLPSSPLIQTSNPLISGISGGLKMPWAFYDRYEASDARLGTIIRYYTDVDGNQVDFRTVSHSKQTGACPMKYKEDPEQIGANQGNDVIVYRYADVLLSKAEAMNMLYGPSEECVKLVNMIRHRAGVPDIKATDFTKETLNDFILEERGRELYCEGVRRDDLIRHGKFVSAARAEGINAESYHELYPIPQSVLDENPKIQQNPGYEN